MIGAPRARRVAAVATAGLASVGFVVIARAVEDASVDPLDVRAALTLQHALDSTVGDACANAASFIGSNLVLLPTVAIVAALAVRLRHRAAAVVLGIDTVVVVGVANLMKVCFARARPNLFVKAEMPPDYSFPSGHAMSAVGVWGLVAAILAVLYPSHRRAIIAVAVPLVISIGLSRIYLGVHWPSDVVAGALAGVPPLLASLFLIRRRPGSRS